MDYRSAAKPAGFTVLGVILALALVLLIARVWKHRATAGNETLVIPEGASVTSAPAGVTLSLPADMSTANLAYYLKTHDGSASGLALYGPAFRQAFVNDGRVPVPTAATDLDTLLQQCQKAYGQDGTLVAEAALIAFTPGTAKDLTS